MKKTAVDLNCDMGESFGHYKLGLDEEVIKLISSANVGCGFHGGDPHVMRDTVAMAKEHGVGVGAHPGLPDLLGFGRREMKVTPDRCPQGLRRSCGPEASARKDARRPGRHGPSR
jgi:UPF0271 protein